MPKKSERFPPSNIFLAGENIAFPRNTHPGGNHSQIEKILRPYEPLAASRYRDWRPVDLLCERLYTLLSYNMCIDIKEIRDGRYAEDARRA